MTDFEQNKRRILDRITILDVVADHVRMQQRGRRWVGLCPFHSEKTPSFTVTPELGLFKCFGCGRGGDVFSFVQIRDNVTFIEAMRLLADRTGVDLAPVGKRDPSQPDRADLIRANEWALGFFRANLAHERRGLAARRYIESRGMDDDVADRFEMGLAHGEPFMVAAAREAGFSQRMLLAADLVRESDDGRVYETFRNRLMFPIRDAANRVIGFGGRTLGDDRAKYLNTRQTALFDKGKNVYGLPLARGAMAETRRVVVVEGYTDCIAAHQAGFAGTVATLGTALTSDHVDLLRRYGDELILLFDSDDAGQAAADRAIRVALPRCMQVRLARIPSGKDPADLLAREGSGAFSDVLNGAVDALEFKWLETQSSFSGTSTDAQRRDAVVAFTQMVGEATAAGAIDAIQKGQIAARVASLTNLAPETAMKLLTQRGKKKGPAVDGGGKSRLVDAEQSSWTVLLEVTLNEPSLMAEVWEELDVTTIRNDRDRRIAEILIDALQREGTVALSDVLARCKELDDTERVAELAQCGHELENYSSRFATAMERLRLSQRDRVIKKQKELVLSGATDEEEQRRQLAELSEGLGRGNRFAGPRHRVAQAITATGDDTNR